MPRPHLAVLPLLIVFATLTAIPRESQALHHWQKKSVMQYTGPQAQPRWGFGTNPDTWGWFGVRYWPLHSWHTGYYGDKREWGYRQGY